MSRSALSPNEEDDTDKSTQTNSSRSSVFFELSVKIIVVLSV